MCCFATSFVAEWSIVITSHDGISDLKNSPSWIYPHAVRNLVKQLHPQILLLRGQTGLTPCCMYERRNKGKLAWLKLHNLCSVRKGGLLDVCPTGQPEKKGFYMIFRNKLVSIVNCLIQTEIHIKSNSPSAGRSQTSQWFCPFVLKVPNVIYSCFI